MRHGGGQIFEDSSKYCEGKGVREGEVKGGWDRERGKRSMDEGGRRKGDLYICFDLYISWALAWAICKERVIRVCSFKFYDKQWGF